MKPQIVGGILAMTMGVLAYAAEKPTEVKSGPQVGARINASFDVRNCNGPDAGDTLCLV
jgi:hypothetical protein